MDPVGIVAIDPLRWPGMNQAFLVSFFGAIAMTLVVIPYGKRRPVDKKASWGEAMFAANYAFFAMFVAFGIAPHQWTDHADADLGWSKDNIVYGPGGILRPQAEGGWLPLTLQYEAVRDTIVVIIHVIYFALLIYVWAWWQKRGQAKPSTELETSTFGRPLVKKA